MRFYTADGKAISEGFDNLPELVVPEGSSGCPLPLTQEFEFTASLKRRDARKLRRLWNGLKPRKEATKKERLEKARKKHKGRQFEN